MSDTVSAAVFPAVGEPPRIERVALPDPGPGQVRVRVAAAGVCHSDLSLANGVLPHHFPAVLGHEGAGTVEAVGPGVESVAVGTPVVLNWSPPCRSCWYCANGEPHLCERAQDAAQRPYAELADGTPVYAGLGTAAFAEATVVPENGVVPLPEAIDPGAAALLGCAVLTGWGAVANTSAVAPGRSAAVIGLGGVGLAVLQAARHAGADPVIAVDSAPAKRDLALGLGATHFLAAGDTLAGEVRGLTGGRGVDHAFEVVGASATIRAAWDITRRGGEVTVVGAGALEDTVALSALEVFYTARTLRGCFYGSSDPQRDIPLLAGHVRAGDLDLASMVTDEIALADLPAAFARMREGRGGRSVVRFP
ncbi:Zn-dependent alcohol dehydrogenase [Streptomonospora nanhaiensis]|uniref:S-(Hydroxymethyl)glutathione dehydrogenase/alcohol dehydrogenase n=1 Tax=Streptomonospora nanhaiensis TaxID=1323731 RepID=A0A853BIQ2_9ACTN|nr:Zn-dependent alcohol dehydrogenase [Streptomonospora nanhaiensis]MBV2365060.1 Zn-dependent alcohol dehydrogenase [Streptomonospora nanhaiensis]MBX9388271.1 Zn-dependent alcohol dehydrogenase [Streptomonospora nanhaiensis]NYI94481.1 S-(hydroxymethyl)glutathione dehydrogenase/alcohol dehydrogenase [Streptomonospora nanhaiensis]